MKVIIAGSRSITRISTVRSAIREAQTAGIVVTQVVSGGARGVDRVGEHLAKSMLGCNIVRFVPDWTGQGRRAGYIRNAEMAQHADALIAVWDGVSSGTKHMIVVMEELGKPIFVKEV